MSIRVIIDESELPAPPEHRILDPEHRFVRHSIDPQFLVQSDEPATFARLDGRKWDQPAYKTHRGRDGTASVEGAHAYADSVAFSSPNQARGAA